MEKSGLLYIFNQHISYVWSDTKINNISLSFDIEKLFATLLPGNILVNRLFMLSQELNEKLLYIHLKAQYISAVIIWLFLNVNVTKDRDCPIKLLELLSSGVGGWILLTVFKMQLLGKFFLCFCPSIWLIIALFPMLVNEFWDLQNLYWKIVKSLFTFSHRELMLDQ